MICETDRRKRRWIACLIPGCGECNVNGNGNDYHFACKQEAGLILYPAEVARDWHIIIEQRLLGYRFINFAFEGTKLVINEGGFFFSKCQNISNCSTVFLSFPTIPTQTDSTSSKRPHFPVTINHFISHSVLKTTNKNFKYRNLEMHFLNN